MYLTREAVSETLGFYRGLPESESCSTMPSRLKTILPIAAQCDSRCRKRRVAGEPWLSLFEPNEVSTWCDTADLGWSRILPCELTDRFYERLKEGIRIVRGRTVRARKIG